MVVEISPRVVCCGPLAQQVELRLQVGHDSTAKEWLVSVANSSDLPACAECVGSESPEDLTIRAKIRPEAPGVLSLIVYALSRVSGCSTGPCEVHALATAPVLVAPNTAVQREMDAVFGAMEEVVLQQLQQAGQAGMQGTASQLTWSLHFQQLLFDMQAILDSTTAKPGCLPVQVAAEVLTGVLEFLGHHGCWCSISWLLAETMRARLLKHAKAAATQRLQQTQPFAGLGGAEAVGAMCAGFIMGLAPSPTRSSHAGVSPIAAVLASNSSTGPGTAAVDSCRSTPSTYCTSACDSASSCSSTHAATHAPSQQQQQQPNRHACWRLSRCHVGRLVLSLTAASLLLLVVLLNVRQLRPCQVGAAPGLKQWTGCVSQSGVMGLATEQAHLLVIMYAPFIVLLLLAVNMASKVCLVL